MDGCLAVIVIVNVQRLVINSPCQSISKSRHFSVTVATSIIVRISNKNSSLSSSLNSRCPSVVILWNVSFIRVYRGIVNLFLSQLIFGQFVITWIS